MIESFLNLLDNYFWSSLIILTFWIYLMQRTFKLCQDLDIKALANLLFFAFLSIFSLL